MPIKHNLLAIAIIKFIYDTVIISLFSPDKRLEQWFPLHSQTQTRQQRME